MVRKKMKGFTLIELIAVLVIMAILALIVTPLVMSIIRKARVAADKRSIDAYGRSIELAIASYLIDNGSFPTQISQLTIEHSGPEVICSTTQLKSDSSVYLAGCTVGGRSVDGYKYGKEESPAYQAYSVGDEIIYNNVTYYVIEDSDENNETVKLLKENPLTKVEIDALNLSGITVEEENSYGKVQYGSSVDYNESTVKQVVDAWKNTAVASGDNATARLISINELVDNFAYESYNGVSFIKYNPTSNTPNWVYNSNYFYCTMSQYQDSSKVWNVDSNGGLNDDAPLSHNRMVRPVLELNKSADITIIN